MMVFESLQVCRAIAALLVTLGHAGGTFALPKYQAEPALGVPFAFGHSGVEFFFVLSGFIIVWNHWLDIDSAPRLHRYFVKRAIRIYPMYWIVFLPVYLIALVSPSLSSSVPSDIWVVIRALALIPFPASEVGGTGAPVLVVAWTLQYEVFFYFIFSAFIFGIRFGIFTVFALGILNAVPDAKSVFPWSFATAAWIYPFVLGAAIAAYFRSSLSSNRKHTGGNRSLVFLSVVAFFGVGLAENISPEFSRFVPRQFSYGIVGAAVVFGLVAMELQSPIRLHKDSLLLSLGNASYALYLIHFPVVSAVAKLAKHIPLTGVVWGFILVFMTTALCCALAILVHRHIEAPLLSMLQRRLLPTNSAGPLNVQPSP